jgi:(heptosyl)LPS beta-1,4-glucosyltransferase
LRQPLRHYTCRDFQSFTDRQMRRAEVIARQLAAQGRRAGPVEAALRSWFTFLKMYVLRAGFLDGAVGWKLARLYARYNRRKYALRRP